MRYFVLACNVLLSVDSLNTYASTLAFLKGSTLHVVTNSKTGDYTSVTSTISEIIKNQCN